MRDGPDIARVAAMVGDPARSAMLLALMDGRALTASELAGVAGVTRPTASSHLAQLTEAEMLLVEAQGRHRYFWLAGPHVGTLLEALMVFSSDAAPPLRVGPNDPALRHARRCYDHLAGELGVTMFDRLTALDALTPGLELTEHGWRRLGQIGLHAGDVPSSNRPLCRACLDWSERRSHLAGTIGRMILQRFYELGWAKSLPASRAIRFSAEGQRRFREWLG